MVVMKKESGNQKREPHVSCFFFIFFWWLDRLPKTVAGFKGRPENSGKSDIFTFDLMDFWFFDWV